MRRRNHEGEITEDKSWRTDHGGESEGDIMKEKHWRRNNGREIMKDEFPDSIIIPEGGANNEGIRGVAELIQEIDTPFDHIVSSIGTGATFLGLLEGLKGQGHLIGISSLKGEFIHQELREMAINNHIPYENYKVHDKLF